MKSPDCAIDEQANPRAKNRGQEERLARERCTLWVKNVTMDSKRVSQTPDQTDKAMLKLIGRAMRNLARSTFFFPMLLFMALAAAPFFWASADSTYRYMGADDYLSPIDIATTFHYAIYPFDQLNGAGLDQPFLVAMLPVYAYYYVMAALGATPLFSTVFLMGLLAFVAQASFFLSLRFFMVRRLDIHGGLAACILGAILYGFSQYMAAQVLPGHCMTLVIYCVFPLVIRYLDTLLIEDKIRVTTLIALFILFAFSSPSLGNIGLLYVLLIAGGLYALSLLLTYRLDFWRTAVRTLLFAVLPFIANGWWLGAHLYNLPRYIVRSRTYGGEMVNLVAYASKDASIANVFQGRPESTVYLVDLLGTDLYITPFHSAVFLILTALIVWAALSSRKRLIYAMLFTALLTLMFMKGVQPPFSGLFLWAYYHVPGFEVMRRPVAKMHGMFLFFFLACATFGMAIAQHSLAARKWIVRGLYAFLCVAAAYTVFSFASISGMKPFNIPPMYFQVRNYLLNDHVERALVLPAITEVRPIYREARGFYSGMDFVTELWHFPKISPNTFDMASDAGYLRSTKELLQLIRGNYPICAASRGLGLSHLIVREDMVASVEEYPARLLATILDKHPDVIPGKKFTDPTGARISVYKLKPQCAGQLLELHGNYKDFSYEVLNPGAIALNVKGLTGAAELTFLMDYNENWELLPASATDRAANGSSPRTITAAYNTPGATAMHLDEVRYLFESSPFKDAHHRSTFANGWTLNASRPEGGNLRLVLYYRPQAILLLGTMVSLLVLLLLVARLGMLLLRRAHRPPSEMRPNERASRQFI